MLTVIKTAELVITDGTGVGQTVAPECRTLKQQVPPAAEIAFTGVYFHVEFP